MAKFNNDSYQMEIEEVIGVITENDTHDWCKAVAKISRNGNPASLDIRNLNLNPDAYRKEGKGISLSDEETDRLVDILLDSDYGSLESLTKAVERKKSRFTVLGQANVAFDDDAPLVINIDV
jgi:hypothetical protein